MITTKLKITLELLKIKDLWNQKHIKLKIHNKIHRKLIFFSSEILAEQEPYPFLETQQGLAKFFSLELTQAEKERSKLNYQKKSKLWINY